jgi:hypothetical protein
MESIKDLIYFDYEKAKSINSQLNGGLINEITKAIENEGNLDSEIGFDVKILRGKIGGGEKEKSLRTERIEIFHELLNNVETSLVENKILTDLNKEFDDSGASFNDFMNCVPDFTYIKATGWSAFEDFDRFQRIMSNFNEIQRLIFTAVMDTNPELKQLKDQIKGIKRGLKSVPNSANHKELQTLKAVEKKFDEVMEAGSEAAFLDEMFVDRIQTFLNTFSPNRLNFRLAPFDEFNNFQILSSLKSRFLVNGDFENVIYTYGSRPDIKLTVFGIITSCPRKDDIRVDLNDEYIGYEDSELSGEAAFEKAFRGVFSSFEGLEKFFFVPTYPKISLSPIAIYREIQLKK